MAKITVISDQAGRVIGTFQTGRPSKDAPTYVPIRLGEGQLLYEVEVADALAAPDSVHKLHGSHRIEGKGASAKLVENKA